MEGRTASAAPATAQISSAIIEYYYRKISVLEDNVSGSLVVEWLKQPEVADGRCRQVADDFAKFLTSKGVVASAECQDDEEEPYDKAWGYNDRRREPGWGQHWLVVVDDGGEKYTIDWTAAQFGYEQFPLVQKFVDGEWRKI